MISLLIVFSVALLAGFKMGETANPIESLFQNSLEPHTEPKVPIPDNDQFNLLIIGVDSVEKADANLQSIWLAAYLAHSEKVTLVPIFPSLENHEQNALLAEAFYLDGSQPGDEFWEALQQMGFWWKGYVVGDLISTIKMIDALGGVYVDEHLINGAQMVSSIPDWEADPHLSIQQQKILLAGICSRLTQNQTSALEVVNEMFLSKFQGGVRAASFVTTWTAMIAMHQNLTCEFPTLNRASSQSISTTQTLERGSP
jgi:hypothetical protein